MSTTNYLDLYKAEMPDNKDDFFNIKKMMNDNWDKLDEAVESNSDQMKQLEYQVVKVDGSKIIATKRTLLPVVYIDLEKDINGAVTISFDNGDTSSKVVDYNGLQLNVLEKGLCQMVEKNGSYILINGSRDLEYKDILNLLATQSEAEAGTDDTKIMTPLKTKQAILKLAPAPPLATPTANGLLAKEDKVKLNGVAVGANNYVHPNDANTRHVTDAEKSSWNAKASTALASTTVNGLLAKEDKTKLNNLPPKISTVTSTPTGGVEGEIWVVV